MYAYPTVPFMCDAQPSDDYTMTEGPLILTPSEAYSIECEIRQSLAMAVSPYLLPHLRQAYQGRLKLLIAKLASARVVQVPNAWAVSVPSSVTVSSSPETQPSALPAATPVSLDEISPSPDTKTEAAEPIQTSNVTDEPSSVIDHAEKQVKSVRISRFTIERTGSSDTFYFLENTTASLSASPIKGILKPARILPSYPESYPDPVPRGAFLVAERMKRVNDHHGADTVSERSSIKVFKVQFDLNRNTTHPIYSREEYYRSDGFIACKTRDSTRDVAIEMNRYKAQEMEVHPQSHANTRYLPVSP